MTERGGMSKADLADEHGHVMADWAALNGAIEGEVVLPDSPEYDRLRTPPMARFGDVRPAAIVRCGTPADVAEALGFASSARLEVAVRSGGRCFAGGSSTRGAWWMSGR